MKRFASAALAALLTVLLLSACGDPQLFSDSETLSATVQRNKDTSVTFNYADGAQELPKAYTSYAVGITDFSLRQLRFRATASTDSFVFSPAAASLQAALLANGASKDTRQEILQALGGGALTLEDINTCSSYFKSRMESVSKADSSEANAAHVTFDSTLLVDEAVDVRSAFLQANADYYGCDIFRFDFKGEHAAQKLNHYWQSHTSDCGVPLNGSLNMVSACTLSDTWLEASAEAGSGQFKGANGAKAMPFFTSNAKLLHNGKTTGVLKYTAGNPLRLLVALPDKGTAFDNWLNGFDNTALQNLLDSMDITKTAKVTLPAISIPGSQTATALSPTLTKSGLFSLFGSKAGFSALSYTAAAAMGDFYAIDADFTLNRDGVNTTTAAPSATLADGEAFTADRPFLFFLLDNETNIPVLAGCYR